ncbi:hypothetical protein CsatB_023786 [Cannabis sativa]
MSDTNEFRKTRSALCNMTNRALKRGISVISGGSELKSGDGYGRKVDIQIEDSKLAKKVCLFKGTDFGVDDNEKGLPLHKGKGPCGSSSSKSSDNDASQSQDNRESSISNFPKEIKSANDLDSSTVNQNVAAEGGDASQKSRESFISNYQGDDLRHGSDVSKTKGCVARVPAVTVCKNKKVGRGADKHSSTKCDPSQWVRLFKEAVERQKELDGSRVDQSVVEEGGHATQKNGDVITNFKKVKDLDGSKDHQSVAAEGGGARDSSLSSISVATSSGLRKRDCSGGVVLNYQDDKLRLDSDATKTKTSLARVPVVTVSKNSKGGCGDDKHASTEYDPSQLVRLFREAVERKKELDDSKVHQSVVKEGGDASQENRESLVSKSCNENKKAKDLDGGKVHQSVATKTKSGGARVPVVTVSKNNKGGCGVDKHDSTKSDPSQWARLFMEAVERNKELDGRKVHQSVVEEVGDSTQENRESLVSNICKENKKAKDVDDGKVHQSVTTKTKSGLARAPVVSVSKNRKSGCADNASTNYDPSQWLKLFREAVERNKELDGRKVHQSVVEEVGDAAQENRESLVSNICNENEKAKDVDDGKVHQSVTTKTKRGLARAPVVSVSKNRKSGCADNASTNFDPSQCLKLFHEAVERNKELDGRKVHQSVVEEVGDAAQENQESLVSNICNENKKAKDVDDGKVHQSVTTKTKSGLARAPVVSVSKNRKSGCADNASTNYDPSQWVKLFREAVERNKELDSRKVHLSVVEEVGDVDGGKVHQSVATKTKSGGARVPVVTVSKNSKGGCGVDKHDSTKSDPSQCARLFMEAVERNKELDGRKVHQSVVEEVGDSTQENRESLVSNICKENKKAKDVDDGKVHQSVTTKTKSGLARAPVVSVSKNRKSGCADNASTNYDPSQWVKLFREAVERNKELDSRKVHTSVVEEVGDAAQENRESLVSNICNENKKAKDVDDGKVHQSVTTKTKSGLARAPVVSVSKNRKSGCADNASTNYDPSQWLKLFREAVERNKELDGRKVHQSVVEEVGDAAQENRESLVSNICKENKKAEDLNGGKVHQSVAAQGCDATKDSSLSRISRATCSGVCNKDCSDGAALNYQDDNLRRDSDATKTKSCLACVPVVTVSKNSKGSCGADTQASTKCDPSEWLKLFNEAVERQKDLDGSRVHQSVVEESGDASQENRESLISNLCKENKKAKGLDGGKINQSVAAQDCEATRDSSLSSISIATGSGFWNKDCSGGVTSNYQDDDLRDDSDATKTKSDGAHVPVVTVCKNSKEDCGADKQASTKPNPNEWSKLFMQSVKPRELGRCSTLKGDGSGDTDVNEELLKSCSCSFCLKAAYIWADLQYQDIKGRISAIKKSQKEANTLVNKSFTEEADIQGRGNPIKSSSLESDLSGQWRSLFCHMEDILIQESNQLQGNFLSLKDMRENCKMDLERINEMPTEKH